MLHVSLVCARFSRAGPPRGGNWRTQMCFFWAMIFLVLIWCAYVGGTRGLTWRGGVATVVGVHPTWCCTRLLDVLHAGLGEGVGDCRGAVINQKRCSFWFLWSTLWRVNPRSFIESMLFTGCKLLNILVTEEEPTSGHLDVCSVGTNDGAFRGKHEQINCKTTFPPRWYSFSG